MANVGRHKRRWTYRRISLLLILVLAVPPLAFYGWFESRSRAIVSERNLNPSYRNALKHAAAAAGFYAMLRTVGFSRLIAEKTVVELGYLNERAELVFKRGKRDTTAEIIKDLHNNMVGIGVAHWMEGLNVDDPRDRWELLVNLGEKGILKLSSRSIASEAGNVDFLWDSSDFDAAHGWFESRRGRIFGDVKRSLAEMPQAGV